VESWSLVIHLLKSMSGGISSTRNASGPKIRGPFLATLTILAQACLALVQALLPLAQVKATAVAARASDCNQN